MATEIFFRVLAFLDTWGLQLMVVLGAVAVVAVARRVFGADDDLHQRVRRLEREVVGR